MRVIGLMSGTSVDGIDAALVEVSGRETDLEASLLLGETFPYPPELRNKILDVCGGQAISMMELAMLDDAIAVEFAKAAQKMKSYDAAVDLIGSHGQTVYHRPPSQDKDNLGYSLQLGRGELIARLTGTTTVSNFRAADIALGGEGAPLVPKIDACLLVHPTKTRAVQNLGGIGNVAYLPPTQVFNWEQQVSGWDTGPGNVLLDLAVTRLTDGKQTYDDDGRWAAQGRADCSLVDKWLEQDFFNASPPKSTGRELFCPDYLDRCWQDMDLAQLTNSDRLATLTELTVASIVDSYQRFLPQMPDEILLCGGGSKNSYLRQRLQAELSSSRIITTDKMGIDSSFKEAIAFGVLAYWRINSIPGNLPQVTGASKPTLLGDIHAC
ncbi:MAG: anhydro-N-acetylmuramic acid kinase [Cyanobacteria bacterium P01_G01_bin.19]